MSTLNVANITDGTTTVGTSYVVNGSAKAWVSVQGNANPQALLGSFNVSSLTDNGTGYGQINLSSSMSNLNYSATTAKQNANNNNAAETFFRDASSSSVVRWSFFESGGSLYDPLYWVGTVHGDLA